MRGVVVFSLVIWISSGFGQSVRDSAHVENNTFLEGNQKADINDLSKDLKIEGLFDVLVEWASEAADYIGGKTKLEKNELHSSEEGRGLKHKKAELKFIMRTLLLLKVVLGLILPLGMISSKILSWKAITLSLMAFMLAKILFVKNLFMGKNAVPVAPANFVPPVFIPGGLNDVFWKRQGDAQNYYSWNSS